MSIDIAAAKQKIKALVESKKPWRKIFVIGDDRAVLSNFRNCDNDNIFVYSSDSFKEQEIFTFDRTGGLSIDQLLQKKNVLCYLEAAAEVVIDLGACPVLMKQLVNVGVNVEKAS